MEIVRLTATDLAILESLSVYRFLTPQQMMRVGVTKNIRHLYATLGALMLRRPRLIEALDFGALPGRGRLPVLYFLTPAGAELHAEAAREEPVPVPKRVRQFANDYDHRRHTVDLHIAARTWAQEHAATVDYVHTYFESDGTHQKTRVMLPTGRVIVPDLIFSLTTPDGIQRLFAAEMYNRKETGRVLLRLLAYRGALDAHAIERAYGYARGLVRILCVFEDERAMALVLERLRASGEFRAIAPHYFFKTLSELYDDFFHGWRPGTAPETRTSLWAAATQERGPPAASLARRT
jgi:hypothetical protein